MNPVQVPGLALIAFGATEFVIREGQAAKSSQRTAADKGTTPLIFGCYQPNDGDMALVTWVNSQKRAVPVLVIGPDGKIRFQSDCEPEGLSAAPHCRPVAGGHGILMRLDGHPETLKVAGGFGRLTPVFESGLRGGEHENG